MNRWRYVITIIVLLLVFSGCSNKQDTTEEETAEKDNSVKTQVEGTYDETLDVIVTDDFAYRIEDEAALLSEVLTYKESVVVPDILLYEGKEYPIEIIGENAFQDASAFREITLPEGLREIQAGAFYGCDNILEITIPDSVEKYGDGIFFNCERLEKIVLGDGLEGIPDETFSNCYALSEVQYPDGLLYIGAEAFWGCENLKKFTFSPKLVSVGSRAFYGSAVEALEIQSTSLKISEDIFEGMDDLKTLTVPADDEKDYKALDSLSEVTVNVLK